MRSPPHRGFTLIELMIAVAVAAILAALAYPSYKETINRSRREDAKATLLENAQWLERQYTVSSRYDRMGNSASIDDDSLPVKEAPKDGAGKNYDIRFATGSPTASGFTLQAVPKNSMSTDKCGTLTLTQAGAPGVITTGTGTVATCWDK